jgi:hypothetical protein
MPHSSYDWSCVLTRHDSPLFSPPQTCGILTSLTAIISLYLRRDDAELRNATLRSLPLLCFAAHVAARGAAAGGPSARALGAAAIAAAAIGDALSLRPHTPAFLSGLILKHLVSPALLIALACVQGGRIPTAPLLVVFAAFAWYALARLHLSFKCEISKSNVFKRLLLLFHRRIWFAWLRPALDTPEKDVLSPWISLMMGVMALLAGTALARPTGPLWYIRQSSNAPSCLMDPIRAQLDVAPPVGELVAPSCTSPGFRMSTAAFACRLAGSMLIACNSSAYAWLRLVGPLPIPMLASLGNLRSVAAGLWHSAPLESGAAAAAESASSIPSTGPSSSASPSTTPSGASRLALIASHHVAYLLMAVFMTLPAVRASVRASPILLGILAAAQASGGAKTDTLGAPSGDRDSQLLGISDDALPASALMSTDEMAQRLGMDPALLTSTRSSANGGVDSKIADSAVAGLDDETDEQIAARLGLRPLPDTPTARDIVSTFSVDESSSRQTRVVRNVQSTLAESASESTVHRTESIVVESDLELAKRLGIEPPTADGNASIDGAVEATSDIEAELALLDKMSAATATAVSAPGPSSASRNDGVSLFADIH